MPECLREDLRDLLPVLLKGALPDAEAARVREHLAGCSTCAAELALLDTTRRVLLAGTPRLDLARISAAVSSTPTLRVVHGAVRTLRPRQIGWGTRRFLAAAASLLVVGSLSVVVARQALDGSVGAAVDTVSTGSRLPVGAAGASGLSISGGLADLSNDDLNALLAALEEVEGTIVAEPSSLRAPLVDTPEGP